MVAAARQRPGPRPPTPPLEAAVEVIAEQGLCDTRIQDVAKRAGASPALVIYYFQKKERLLGQALTYAEERFYTSTAEALATLGTARERLVRLLELSCAVGEAGDPDLVDEWVLWLDLWARAPRDAEVARARETLDRRWRGANARVLPHGQQAGEFSPVDAGDFSLRLAALIDGLALQVVLGGPDVTPERM